MDEIYKMAKCPDGIMLWHFENDTHVENDQMNNEIVFKRVIDIAPEDHIITTNEYK